MLRNIQRGLRALPKRSFALEQYPTYIEHNMIERGPFFLNLKQVYELDQKVSECANRLDELFKAKVYEEGSVMLSIMKEYAESRKIVGRNDYLLMKTLRHLADYQAIRGEETISKDDIFGQDLFNSAKFQLIIEDTQYFCRDQNEFRGEIFAGIVHSLNRLGFKERKLLRTITAKALIELLDMKKNSISNMIYGKLFSEDLHKVMSVDTRDKLSSKQSQSLIEEHAGQSPQVEDVDIQGFEHSLDNVKQVLKSTNKLHLDFINAITALRDNYFSLKEGQKAEAIKRKPELYLDFLFIEEKMMEAGALMPFDLLSKKNDPETNEIASLQTSFELGLYPNVKPEKQTEIIDPQTIPALEAANRKYRRETAMLCLLTMIEWTKSSHRSFNPFDDLADTRFGFLFGRDTEKFDTMEFTHFEDFQQVALRKRDLISKSRAKTPLYFYTYTYRDFRETVEKFLPQLESQKFDALITTGVQALLTFADLSSKAVDSAVEAQPKSRIEGEWIVDILIAGLEHFSLNSFLQLVNSIDQDTLISQLKARISDPTADDILKSNYMFLVHVLKQHCESYSAQLSALDALIQTDGFLVPFTDPYAKAMIPNDGNFLKAYIYLQGLGADKTPPIVSRTKAKLEYLLFLTGQVNRQRDPGLELVTKLIKADSGFDIKNISLTQTLPPQLMAQGQIRGELLFVLPIGQKEQSVLSDVVRKLNGRVRLVSMFEFFKDRTFYSSLDFAFNDDKELVSRLFEQSDAEYELETRISEVFTEAFNRTPEAHWPALVSLEKLVRRMASKASRYPTQLSPEIKVLIIQWVKSMLPPEEAEKIIPKVEQVLGIVSANQAQLGQKQLSGKLPFYGRRIGLEVSDVKDKFSMEFVNKELLLDHSYFVFQEWADQLGKYVSELDFQKFDDHITSTYAKLERVILPNPHGRQQARIKDFSLFWEYAITPKPEIPTEKYMKYESLAHTDSKIHKKGFHFCLLNLIYNMRLISDFDDFFTKFFALPFISKMVSPAAKTQPVPLDPPLPQWTPAAQRPQSTYEKRIQVYRDMATKLAHLKEMNDFTLPRLIMSASKEEDRQRYRILSEKYKKDYHEVLKEYKKVLTDHSSNYNFDQFKDLVTKVTFSIDNDLGDGKSAPKPVDPTQNCGNLLMYYNVIHKKLHKIPLSTEESDYNKAVLEKVNGKSQGAGLDVKKFDLNFAIGDIFSPQDFEFFRKNFTLVDLEPFKQHSFADLCAVLEMFFNRDLVEHFGQFNMFHSLSKSNAQAALQLFEEVTDYVPNSLILNSIALEHAAELKTKRISENDVLQLQNLFSVNQRERTVHREWNDRDRESLAAFVEEANKRSTNPIADVVKCKLIRVQVEEQRDQETRKSDDRRTDQERPGTRALPVEATGRAKRRTCPKDVQKAVR